MDIEGKSSFQQSVYTEFFELVTNLTMDSKVIDVKCKLCPPPKDVFSKFSCSSFRPVTGSKVTLKMLLYKKIRKSASLF